LEAALAQTVTSRCYSSGADHWKNGARMHGTDPTAARQQGAMSAWDLEAGIAGGVNDCSATMASRWTCSTVPGAHRCSWPTLRRVPVPAGKSDCPGMLRNTAGRRGLVPTQSAPSHPQSMSLMTGTLGRGLRSSLQRLSCTGWPTFWIRHTYRSSSAPGASSGIVAIGPLSQGRIHHDVMCIERGRCRAPLPASIHSVCRPQQVGQQECGQRRAGEASLRSAGGERRCQRHDAAASRGADEKPRAAAEHRLRRWVVHARGLQASRWPAPEPGAHGRRGRSTAHPVVGKGIADAGSQRAPINTDTCAATLLARLGRW